MNRRGFTLIELLVVIAIIAILIGILLPVLSKARKSSQRVTCASHLADFGKLFQMYLNDSKGKLPWVRPMPTVLLPPNTFPLMEIFDPYTKKVRGGWECPADYMKDPAAGAGGYESYFQRDGISYFYNPFLAEFYNGEPWNAAIAGFRTRWAVPQNRLSILHDFEPFHGRPNTPGCTNHIFADMHVGDIE